MVTRAELQRRTRISQARARTRAELLQRKIQRQALASQRARYKERAEGVVERIEKGQITSEAQIPEDIRPGLNIPKDYFSQRASYEKWKREAIANKSKLAWGLWWHNRSASHKIDVKKYPVEVRTAYRQVQKSMKHGFPVAMVKAFDKNFPGSVYFEAPGKVTIPVSKEYGYDIRNMPMYIAAKQIEEGLPPTGKSDVWYGSQPPPPGKTTVYPTPVVGVIEDVREPIPTVISLPKPLPERVKFVIGDVLTKATLKGREMAKGLATLTTVPGSLAEEQRVESISLPSIPGATQITRSVGFQDIDTGVLPPRQNLELKSTKILLDFSLGKISEDFAEKKLEKAQKRYVWEESKRTAALRFIEGAGIGALTVLAPPVGWSIIGITGADAISRRKEILAFAKTNPKAAAIQFGAGVVGGIVGAGGVSMLKTKAVKFREPTIKLTGKARIKLINKVLENLEPEARAEFAVMKKTATRTFTIDIPSPKNKVSLKIVEFTKNGKKMFAGLEFVNGKVRTGIGGLSLVKGKGGDAKIITRSIRLHTKKGLTNLEMAEYLERVSTKAVKSKGLRSIALTENEVKLAKMFDLKGLTPDQVREILRRPLFGTKEAQKRMNVPFTDSEFKMAAKLSKSKFITSRDIVKTRLTNLNEQLGPLLAERDIVDIRVTERGIGSVDITFNLPKPVFKIKPKIGRVRVPGEVRGIGIIIKKSKLPKRTPLSRTFAKETDTILLKKISSGEKILQLQKLKKQVSPVGAYKSIAKTIQQQKINLAIKQAQGKALVTGVVTGIKVTPKAKELAKQKQLQLVKQLSKQKDGQSIAWVSSTLVKEAEKLAVAGKITPVQLQTLKTKLILKQRLIIPTTRVPTRVPKPLIVLPIIRVPKGVAKTKTVKALIGLGKQGVDIVIGLKERKKKIIRKNLPAFKAFKFGREFVDKNIEASYKLVPSGKKAKGKDIKPFNVGIKFRPSKVNPLFLVEKRKYRLDSPLEKAQIRRARRLAPKKKVKRRIRRK